VFAHVLESDVVFVANLIASSLGEADRSRPGNHLQVGGNVDAVAVDISLINDDVADVDPDAEDDPPISGTPAFRATRPS